MKLYTVGPVEMYSETLKLGGEALPYFRTSEFSEVMRKIESDYLTLLHAPYGSKAVVLTASGTAAMEAAVINCLDKNDKVLVIAGGGFGKRFCEICEIYEIPYEPLYVELGEPLTMEMLEQYEGKGFTALLVNIHETSTGQLYNAKMLGDFCKKNEMLYVIDAISSFLADPLDMEITGADLILVSSQKALSLPPGLSLIAVNDRTYERIMKHPVRSMYFDLRNYFVNMERGQTPYTPAVGIVLQLADRLDDLVKQGIDDINQRHEHLAKYFRSLCDENHMDYIHSCPLSNALTVLSFRDQNAKKVYEDLKTNYGIVLNPCGGKWEKYLLRVGHLGNLQEKDYEQLIIRLKEVL